MSKEFILSTQGSERATSEAGNKVVTVEGKTHVTWQDVNEDGYFNRVRTLDRRSGEWSETYTLDRAVDNHARAVITADTDGFLHIVLGGHGTPCMYRKSLKPNDASAWSEPEPIAHGTYPFLISTDDNHLHLTLRNAYDWNGVDLLHKAPDGMWRLREKIIRHDKQYFGYAAFASGMIMGRNGHLHVANDFFEGYGTNEEPGFHQAIAYMRSDDKLYRWHKADGTPVSLPASPDDMDALARSIGPRYTNENVPLMSCQGCVAVDTADKPWVLYVYHLNEPGQLLLATPDENGRWRQRSIAVVKESFPEYRPLMCRGAFDIDGDNVFRALMQLLPLDVPGWHYGKPTRGMKFGERFDAPLVWLISRDGGETFAAEEAVPTTGDRMLHQPKFELPVGANCRPAGTPDIVCFDGLARYAEEGEIIQNNVIWIEGNQVQRGL